MKKIFTLITALLALSTATGWAQDTNESTDGTFVFTDLEGNVVPDGSVLTITAVNNEGQMTVPLRAKNVSGAKAAVSMYETIDAKPAGEWQTCAFGNCMTLSATGYSPKNIVEAGYDENIQTEWIPVEGQYATWTATLQIHVFNITQTSRFGQIVDQAGSEIIGYGPKVTVQFVYSDNTGIAVAEASQGQPTARYDLSGSRLSAPRRGLNIVRLSNGEVVKHIVK